MSFLAHTKGFSGLDGLGVEGSPQAFEQAGEMFAKNGYTPVVKMVWDAIAQPAS